MEKKYAALRTIGTIYKILGAIVAVLTLLVVIGICATSVLGGAFLNSLSQEFGGGMGGMFGGVVGGILTSLFLILNGGGLALTFYALGEGIYVLLALEENTRATAALLRQKEDL